MLEEEKHNAVKPLIHILACGAGGCSQWHKGPYIASSYDCWTDHVWWPIKVCCCVCVLWHFSLTDLIMSCDSGHLVLRFQIGNNWTSSSFTTSKKHERSVRTARIGLCFLGYCSIWTASWMTGFVYVKISAFKSLNKCVCFTELEKNRDQFWFAYCDTLLYKCVSLHLHLAAGLQMRIKRKSVEKDNYGSAKWIRITAKHS